MSKATLYNYNNISPVTITREVQSNVGSGEVILGLCKRGFKGTTDFQIWSAPTGGVQLTEGVDYTVGSKDTRMSAEAGFDVFTTYKILNVSYQTGNIYINYKIVYSYVDADFFNTFNAYSVGGYIPGNGSGAIPISNGTVCTNLNAEKVGSSTLAQILLMVQMPSSIVKNASYVVLDNDGYTNIGADTTSGDITFTLPLKANNVNRRLRFYHAKGGTNKVILSPNGTDANKITKDGLNAIWLPKVGDYMVVEENATTGFWEVVDERITCRMAFDAQAGYGGTDNKIPRFTNASIVGNMCTENHASGYSSNAKGLEITIQKSGEYAFTFTWSTPGSSATNFGISLNADATDRTNAPNSVATSKMLTRAYFSAATADLTETVSDYFAKGDIVRPHTAAGTPTTANNCKLAVLYLG
jgi:hypothetical protein